VLYQMRAKGEQVQKERARNNLPLSFPQKYRDSMAVGERKEMLVDAS
jgi:hypothetical protein